MESFNEYPGAKNTLWCFGDSFTYGSGCRDLEHTEYYYKYPERRVNRGIFPLLIGDNFKMNVANVSYPGSSDLMILENIILKSTEIKKGDRIIIGMSDSSRSETFRPHSPDAPKIEDQRWERISLNHYISNKSPIFNWFTRAQVVAAKKFIVELKLFSAEWAEIYNQKLAQNLTKILPVTHSYIWGATQWKDFETIYEDTDGKILDHHFSWKGHQQFADKVIADWKKTKNYVSKIQRFP